MLLFDIVLAYLIGSIPFGVLVGNLKGRDIRRHGSGNIGATNALRVLGLPSALAVLAGDVAKGIAAVLIARATLGTLAGEAVVGLAAIAGHNWSIFLRFRGGKGVATSLGVAFMLSPVLTLAVIGVFVVVVALTRYVSLGSVVAGTSAWLIAYILDLPPAIMAFCLVGGAFIVERHIPNLKRVIAGKENRLGRARGSENAP
ncbi:MAG TPA: glycerol-3-phosphate 1-O-acyltransferase PlsY [Firmicutes bacterium]|nr:glycerol-3-phosphate 1-O-acyltransferase PlsY [Bacillota bacterium]